ncbi:MAG TPA: tetratricopeptide repeat protein [Polyangiaceae bacterium]
MVIRAEFSCIGLGFILSFGCSPGLGDTEFPTGKECNALRPPSEPDLLALEPADRAAFASIRAQGIAVVHYEQKGCDMRLELLSNCLVRGEYQFVPYWEQDTKSARTAKELFTKLPVGAFSVAGKVTRERSLRADYMLAGMAQLPIGYRFDASHLVGECMRATHVVTRMYLGGFTLAAGKSDELAAQASVFVETGARTTSSFERVRYAGDPKSCEDSRKTRREDLGCATPLRLTLMPLAETRECIGVAECQARCNGGEAASCVSLGGIYLNGNGVPADLVRGSQLLKQACDRGDMSGCANLGISYLKGVGVTQDFRQASSLLHRACEVGISWSCGHLGSMHVSGSGMPVDLLAGGSLFQRACAGGDAGGCTAAVEALNEVCNAGDERGCFELGGMYGRGEGVSKDPKRTGELMTLACNKGLTKACLQLATLHLRGFGVPVDPSKAVELYSRYCNSVQSDGCLALGLIFMDGDGVAQDYGKAMAHFQRACDAGDPMGCGGVAQMLLDGKGVAVDQARALALFVGGCDANCAGCCSGVADIYENGRGVKADLRQAREFYLRACNGGDEDSCRAVERLKSAR